MNKRIKIPLIIGAILLVVDRITKVLALNFLQHKVVKIIPGFQLSFTWNRGISWGMFNDLSQVGFYFLTAILITIVGLFVAYLISEYKRGTNILFESIVLVGAVSNIMDRVLYGGVVDFIDLYAGTYHWPTFNLADVFIVIGIGGVLIRSMYYAYLGKFKDD